jgi:plastocyanin
VAALSANKVFSFLIFGLGLVLASSFSAFSQASDSVVVIRMTNEMKFVPNQVTVKVGQTVEWVGEPDGPSHNVTTDPEKVVDPGHVSFPRGAKPFDSGIIKSGKSFRHTFTTPGVYRYVCQPHEGVMRGEVTVTE